MSRICCTYLSHVLYARNNDARLADELLKKKTEGKNEHRNLTNIFYLIKKTVDYCERVSDFDFVE